MIQNLLESGDQNEWETTDETKDNLRYLFR